MNANGSWILFIHEHSWKNSSNYSWIVHEDPMNLLLDILEMMNLHEYDSSWIIHEKKYSWIFINFLSWIKIHDLKMSNNKFIGSSWTFHEHFMN